MKCTPTKCNSCKSNEEEVKNLTRTWRAKAAAKKEIYSACGYVFLSQKTTHQHQIYLLRWQQQDPQKRQRSVRQKRPTSAVSDSAPAASATTNEEQKGNKEETLSVRTSLQCSTPAQDAANEELHLVSSKMASLLQMKNTRLWTDEMKKQSEECSNKKIKLKQKLKRLAAKQARKQSARLQFKRKLSYVAEEHLEVGRQLKTFCRKKVGRPRLEDDQPQLLKTRVDIVIIQCTD